MGISHVNVRKMNSLFIHRFQMAQEFRRDCDEAKEFFNIMAPASVKNSIEGFIQEISSNPFGFYTISEIQVIILIKKLFFKNY